MKSRCIRPSSITQHGFTLVELLAVIVIIGILAGFVLGISNLANRKASESRAKAEIEEIRMALERGRASQGIYFTPNPTTVTNMDHNAFTALTNHPYSITMQHPFIDPWGRPYVFRRNGDFQVEVYSEGPTPGDSSDNIR